MMEPTFEVIKSEVKKNQAIDRGKDIYYKCTRCQSIIPSVPADSISCPCGNIVIDKDLLRLYIENYSEFIILRKINDNKNNDHR